MLHEATSALQPGDGQERDPDRDNVWGQMKISLQLETHFDEVTFCNFLRFSLDVDLSG